MSAQTPDDLEQRRRDERREIRAENYRVKASHDFACAECGTTERVLAVDVKASGETSTRCEDRCLDRRSVTVRPLQFDERERDAAST